MKTGLGKLIVMLNVTVDTSRNSPKREFLKDWNIAFAEGNSTFILDSVSDDVILGSVTT